jgi:protein TonB
MPEPIKKKLRRLFYKNLFLSCFLISAFMHGSGYLAYFISTLPSEYISSDVVKLENVEVDFDDIPPELYGGSSNPAPVEKHEWVEGTGNNTNDPVEEDINYNAVSGTGTDKDGYLFSFNGDRPPQPIIDFDLKKFFPNEAKWANITQKTVIVRVQVEADGKLTSAKIVSGKAGYGFDEAAMLVINRARFVPGYLKGKPTRMVHELPIRFVLE